MKCFICFIFGAVALACLQSLEICGYGYWVQLAASFLFSVIVQIIEDFKKGGNNV